MASSISAGEGCSCRSLSKCFMRNLSVGDCWRYVFDLGPATAAAIVPDPEDLKARVTSSAPTCLKKADLLARGVERDPDPTVAARAFGKARHVTFFDPCACDRLIAKRPAGIANRPPAVERKDVMLPLDFARENARQFAEGIRGKGLHAP